MPTVREVTPGRLEIREGGGCLSIFGLPFLAVGIFAALARLGLVRVSGDAPPVVLGILFGLVGAMFVFGRRVVALDLAQQVVIRQWRLLVPIRSWTYQLSDYGAVTIGFERGDADSADQYPVALKGRSGGSLVLCRPSGYAEARDCAAAVARHLGLDIEDRSTGHATRVAVTDADTPLQTRLRSGQTDQTTPARPAAMRSDVTDTGDGIRITIPLPRVHPLTLVAALFPAVVAAAMLQWIGFFSRTRPLASAEWIFLGVLLLGFTVLPVATAFNRWLRSRVGRTIVTVSREGLRIEERGTSRIRTVADLGASEIVDVDFGTRESLLAAARTDAQKRVVNVLGAFVTGSGIIVKSRKGLTTFGEGLADDEIEYLHAVVRRALAG